MLQSTFDFALIYGLFGLSTYVALSVGLLSVATVVFGAVGGFVYASISVDHGASLWVGVLAGAILGGLAALVLSFIFLRLESDYFAVATIALVLISLVVTLNLDYTGGPAGKSVPQQGNRLDLLIIVIVSAFILARLRRSRFGLASESVRQDVEVASTLGINANSIRRVGFVLSGVFGGMAGVMLADSLQYINQGTYQVDLALNMLAAAVLGGAFHWLGPLVGSMIFQFIPQLLQGPLGSYQEAVTGAILVVIMIYLPGGVVDVARWKKVLTWARRRTRSKAVVAGE